MALRNQDILQLLKYTGILLASILLTASLSVYFSPRFGSRVDGLRSGSMSPEMKTGDLVVTSRTAPDAIVVGDIVTFRYPGETENLVSHRVIGIQRNSPLSFTTKGDANNSPDPFVVQAHDVVGKVSFHFPALGYAVIFMKTERGLVSTLVAPGMAIILACLAGIRHELVKSKTPRAGISGPSENEY